MQIARRQGTRSGHKSQGKLPCKMILEQKCERVRVIKKGRVIQVRKIVYTKAL